MVVYDNIFTHVHNNEHSGTVGKVLIVMRLSQCAFSLELALKTFMTTFYK